MNNYPPKIVSGPQLKAPARNKNTELKAIPQDPVNMNNNNDMPDSAHDSPVPNNDRPLNALKCNNKMLHKMYEIVY